MKDIYTYRDSPDQPTSMPRTRTIIQPANQDTSELRELLKVLKWVGISCLVPIILFFTAAILTAIFESSTTAGVIVLTGLISAGLGLIYRLRRRALRMAGVGDKRANPPRSYKNTLAQMPKKHSVAIRIQQINQKLSWPKRIGLLFAFLFACLILIGTFENSISAGVILSIIFAAIFGGIPARSRKRKLIIQNLEEKIANIIVLHIATLAKRRELLVTTDPYGTPLLNEWKNELNGFIKTQITPKILDKESPFFADYRWKLPSEIDMMVLSYANGSQLRPEFREGMTPYEFEVFCADLLTMAGWNARVTPESRAQGVNISAERGNFRLVVQCKPSKLPIGPDAVQAIIDGRLQANADYAALVSNREFTEPASHLARISGIFLLHYSELEKINLILQ